MIARYYYQTLKMVLTGLCSILILTLTVGCATKKTETPKAPGNKQVLNLGAVKDFKAAMEGKNLVFETHASSWQ